VPAMSALEGIERRATTAMGAQQTSIGQIC
jgi:hypothetical protein